MPDIEILTLSVLRGSRLPLHSVWVLEAFVYSKRLIWWTFDFLQTTFLMPIADIILLLVLRGYWISLLSYLDITTAFLSYVRVQSFRGIILPSQYSADPLGTERVNNGSFNQFLFLIPQILNLSAPRGLNVFIEMECEFLLRWNSGPWKHFLEFRVRAWDEIWDFQVQS